MTRWTDKQCRQAAFDVMLDYDPKLAELHVGHALLDERAHADMLAEALGVALSAFMGIRDARPKDADILDREIAVFRTFLAAHDARREK